MLVTLRGLDLVLNHKAKGDSHPVYVGVVLYHEGPVMDAKTS